MVRFLWLITTAMVLVGAAIVLGSLVAGMGPIVLVGGVLLFWSGIVKAVVLRMWRTVLPAPSATDAAQGSDLAGNTLSRQS